MNDKTKACLCALETAAAAIAAVEGVPGWIIEGGVALVEVVAKLIENNANDASLQDAIDTMSELGKAALDAKKFGNTP